MLKITPSENKYLYNGKEIQDEQLGGVNLDLYDYHSRYYDPALGRFTTQDPLAEVFSSWTPYHYVHNNPIIFTDPTGMFANPIYDKEANFLGTDDKGLQGEAIVMNKDEFKQGMAHSEAVDKGTLRSEMPLVTSSEIFDNIDSHQAGLSGRPDWDGKMSYGELVQWGKENGDSPVFLDASKIDLGNISVSDFPGVGEGRRINTVGRRTPLDTYGPWGKNYMRLMSADGLVRLSSDEFDYRKHDLGKAWDEGIKTFLYESLVRSPAVGVLKKIHRVDNDFKFTMHPYGMAKIKK